MKKIRKETNQIPVVIWANIMAMSVENNNPVTVFTKAGQEYTGIIVKPFKLFSGADGVFLTNKNNDDTEVHSCIPYDSIDSISFTTPSGLLDDLIDNLN